MKKKKHTRRIRQGGQATCAYYILNLKAWTPFTTCHIENQPSRTGQSSPQEKNVAKEVLSETFWLRLRQELYPQWQLITFINRGGVGRLGEWDHFLFIEADILFGVK